MLCGTALEVSWSDYLMYMYILSLKFGVFSHSITQGTSDCGHGVRARQRGVPSLWAD